MTDFERFQEHGRLRQISKNVDPYSLVFENNDHLYIALSSGQTVSADKFHGMRDFTIYCWLKVLLTIGLDKWQQPLSNRTIETI